MPLPNWIPERILLQDFSGNWNDYIDSVYETFYEDMIKNPPYYESKKILLSNYPSIDEKHGAFWHYASDGKGVDEIVNIERCSRLCWIKPIIENCNDSRIKVWQDVKSSGKRRNDKRTYAWFNDEYLVVLAEKNWVYFLITATTTEYPSTKRKLEKSYLKNR